MMTPKPSWAETLRHHASSPDAISLHCAIPARTIEEIVAHLDALAAQCDLSADLAVGWMERAEKAEQERDALAAEVRDLNDSFDLHHWPKLRAVTQERDALAARLDALEPLVVTELEPDGWPEIADRQRKLAEAATLRAHAAEKMLRGLVALPPIDALTAERDALAARLDTLEPLAREVAWRGLEGTRGKYGWPDVFAVERLEYDADTAEARAILALLDTPRTPEAT